ncbi:hypothetical protein Purlil1_14260 [Purpureocillium lilacinum]|uniref:Uncharacterized protein n=1 Tax=Purpureocillium lilacinum TaxID=33203 RepID=A0ABR0BBR6_PURLI|nr:hypothetical protein Purlil1_14260 [Purpureocillium lilacinum]
MALPFAAAEAVHDPGSTCSLLSAPFSGSTLFGGTLFSSPGNTHFSPLGNTHFSPLSNTVFSCPDNTLLSSPDNTLCSYPGTTDNTIFSYPGNTILSSPDSTLFSSPDNTYFSSPDNTLCSYPGTTDHTIFSYPGNTIFSYPGRTYFSAPGDTRSSSAGDILFWTHPLLVPRHILLCGHPFLCRQQTSLQPILPGVRFLYSRTYSHFLVPIHSPSTPREALGARTRFPRHFTQVACIQLILHLCRSTALDGTTRRGGKQ